MKIDFDGSGNMYAELHSSDYGGKKEFLRITLVEKELGNPCFRFQIRENKGRLRAMGPEFPVTGLDELIAALNNLK